MGDDYQLFLDSKRFVHKPCGIDVDESLLNSNLFPFQQSIVRLALKLGKFCIWANTGLGKTLMSLSWSDALIRSGEVKNLLILAPLGVAKQTVGEGEKFGIGLKYCADQCQVEPGITITNYDRLHLFDKSSFDAIVLDESSILKHRGSATCNEIIDAFKHTPYKLACSATPAPNDHTEIGNQCEFLGVMTRQEMLSTFFINDQDIKTGSKWRLKGHSSKAFWEFVSSWAIMIRLPSELGFSDEGYVLPPIEHNSYSVSTVIKPPDGQLVWTDFTSMSAQRYIRKMSCNDRCKVAADIVNSSSERFNVWCETIPESKLLKKLIPDAVEVEGSQSAEFKESAMYDFAQGKTRVLITKPKIAGMGLNFQICHNVIFIGLTYSFEMYFQTVRRNYRFGQKNQVNVHIVQHDFEGTIIQNLEEKERKAEVMAKEMSKHMKSMTLHMLDGATKRVDIDYSPNVTMIVPTWMYSSEE